MSIFVLTGFNLICATGIRLNENSSIFILFNINLNHKRIMRKMYNKIIKNVITWIIFIFVCLNGIVKFVLLSILKLFKALSVISLEIHHFLLTLEWKLINVLQVKE